MKKICVLLSTFNGEKYLKELIDSVLKQDTKNGYLQITLFARDDGSSDGTVNILKHYAEKNLITLYDDGKPSCNLGFSKSFSNLLKRAPKADYYSFCDQDDVWLPKKLINAVNAFEAEDETLPLMYSTNLIVTDKDLKEITRETHLHYTRNSPTQFEENLLQNNTYGCTIVINERLRELYLKVPVEDIKFHDYTMAVIASGAGKFIYEDNPQILYRQHDGNTIGFYKGSLKNVYRSLEFFFKNDLQNNKYRNVKICSDYFYDLLPENRKRFVDLLVNYRNDKLKKKKLINYIETKISNPFIKNYSLFLIRLNKF